MNKIITNKEISIGARLLYLYLQKNKDNDNKIKEKGVRQIAQEIGTSYQSVIRYLGELEEQNLISRTTIVTNAPQIIELI
ncbi:replication protein (RepL) [Alkalithermobacter thermoalcaliphilus JW-YL-7 = DSM 7308]|uniref:Firmicute plasmid replication family protein n=1 Tax=Alkalithermobacter thermoalcaliphilus JW-YL-7 = DSM 7308 TaxID=1121328 RepID=A0A150FPA0_CLOPD|nr:firmicute plasmid replication family protein [[Clostridium] paradoxum JW-YL-7 = DSM 7308]SHK50756.1 replication protein (RepL) [[Clostridium] paradoxum JW-YL-7 = DSM 7308]